MGKFLIIISGPEGATGYLEPYQEWCFHVRMARWSLKIVIDPKLRLVEKTHTELVEYLQADPRVFLASPPTWLCEKTLRYFFRWSTSSRWVFSTSHQDVKNYQYLVYFNLGLTHLRLLSKKNLRRVLESWKSCDFKTAFTFYFWLSEVWEKDDLLTVLFSQILSNYSILHWQKFISWKFDESLSIFCKIESIYVHINSLQIIKSSHTAVLGRFRFWHFAPWN